MKRKELSGFVTKELVANLAERIVEKLENKGYLDRAKHKDNLTDIIDILSSLDDNDESDPPEGTVIAADGTVVTLSRKPGNTRLYTPPGHT